MFEIVGKTNINFMGQRKVTFGLSGLLIAIGLFAVIQILWGSANLGIDFSGGTAVQLKFDKPLAIESARDALGRHGLGDAELQEFTQDNKLLIRVKAERTIEQEISKKIIQVFQEEFKGHSFVVDSSTSIGPTIGNKLQQDALVAITLSLIGIILYIAGSIRVSIWSCSSFLPRFMMYWLSLGCTM